jgi:hypothetical protein
VEVWFCPEEEYIAPHIHKRIDSNIVLLFGKMIGKIAETRGYVRAFKWYPVPAGTVHSAETISFCVFANAERWQGEPTSAAEDFTAV